MKKFIAAMLFALGASTGAQAALLVGSNNLSGNVVTDFSQAGQVSFDLDLFSLPKKPLELTFLVEAGDGADIGFNAIFRNLMGTGLENIRIAVSNAAFSFVGSVSTFFGSNATVFSYDDPNVQKVVFDPAENFEFFVGAPTGAVGDTDWGISLAGLNPGDQFSIRVSSVPEPGSLALLLGGLGLLGYSARRSRG